MRKRIMEDTDEASGSEAFKWEQAYTEGNNVRNRTAISGSF